MKKIILFSVSACLLFTVACNKSTTPNNNTTTPQPIQPTIPTDGWILDGVKHKQVLTVRQESQFLVNALDGTSSNPKPATFAVSFKAYPTASGKYKIVALVPDPNKPYPYMQLNDGEVIVVPTTPNTTGNNTTYWSIGTDNKEATVTVTNGKLKIEIPEILVTSTKNDTLKVAGTIIE